MKLVTFGIDQKKKLNYTISNFHTALFSATINFIPVRDSSSSHQYILIYIREIIKQNCDFVFYYNKSDITLTVLDGSNEIILANWPDDKCIICTINNDIPIEIQSYPYVLVNRSELCNCGIEAENNYLLESLAACHDSSAKLIMYFILNLAFTNYINQFNLKRSWTFP